MDWIPKDTDILTVFGAILAVGATVLGLVVGLGQLSGAARASRTIEWTSAALSVEKDSARQMVLERLKLRGQGYLIAAQYVPWWRFSSAIAWTLLSPAFVISAASRSSETLFLVIAVVAGVLNLTIMVRKAIRLYSERTRVARQFVLGGSDVEPVRIDTLAQMEGGTKREFLLGFVCAVTVMGTGVLLALALVEGCGSDAWLWVFVGGSACWGAFQVAHVHATQGAHQLTRLPAGHQEQSSQTSLAQSD
ncbi:hypothetical protein [Arthrobacter glacialis]|uniref:Uncharacterized protein n=1 Tax=Arthrobacter glacialis TaxID=1664 RepID=A0A2S4A1C5_ARTGL|nr:hypothetical protein [Arthrobacter glacialis]POH75174.1 hypothetical protein CVS27_00750 [Arthrobacter glacialis]